MRAKRLLWSIAIVAAFTAGWSAFLIHHQAAGDFWVYLGAVQHWFDGGNVYDVNYYGHTLPPQGMAFTYTPFALFTLAPLGWMPWQVDIVLWTAVVLTIVYLVIERLTPPMRRRGLVVFALMCAMVGEQIVAENLYFTQINMALMALVLIDLLRPEDHPSTRWLPRGVLIGIATAIKLTPALFIVFFLLTRQWRIAIWSTVSAAAATLLALAVMPTMSWQYWTHLGSLQDKVSFVPGGTTNPNNSSIRGIFAAAAPDFPRIIVTALIALAGLAVLAAAVYVHRRGRSFDAALIIGMALPILSPVGWVHHYAFAVPAALILIFRIRWTLWQVALAVLLYNGLAIGPDRGDPMVFKSAPWWEWPVGALSRESPFLTAVTLIVALTVSARQGDRAVDQRFAFWRRLFDEASRDGALRPQWRPSVDHDGSGHGV